MLQPIFKMRKLLLQHGSNIWAWNFYSKQNNQSQFTESPQSFTEKKGTNVKMRTIELRDNLFITHNALQNSFDAL